MNEENNKIELTNAGIEELLKAAETSPEAESESQAEGKKQEEEKPAETSDKDKSEEKVESAFEELKKVTEEIAREDEQPASSTFALTKILGGDILSTEAIRSQVWLILLIAAFTIVYVANRYNCQKKLIEIDKLNREVQDAKYKALSISSELTELSRESNVLEKLKENKDSSLKISSQPPYIVKIK